MNKAHALLLLILATFTTLSALAHHGQAAYDRSTKLTEFRFINPHSQIAFDVVIGSEEVDGCRNCTEQAS